jgi:hypothetical protein
VNELWRNNLWQQFDAAIDYLADTMDACPDELWVAPLWKTADAPPEFSQFWYVTYHTLFWLDLYLTGTEEDFFPPSPFTLIEQTENSPLPERVYQKIELQGYLIACREKCMEAIKALTDDTAQRLCTFGWGECSYLELMLYNIRHVHGHASQLNMLLGQNGVMTGDYVTQTRNGLSTDS